MDATTYAHARAYALEAADVEMRLPRPPRGPPKYSATRAEITASDEAMRMPVRMNGRAVGRVSVRSTWPDDAAYAFIRSRCTGVVCRKPRSVLMNTGTNEARAASRMPRIEPTTRPMSAFVPVRSVACTIDGQ